jgi:tetrahydromethanopterin S-methyltransferase subunit C
MENLFNSILLGALGSKLAEAYPTNTIIVIGFAGIIFGVILSMVFPKMWKAVK